MKRSANSQGRAHVLPLRVTHGEYVNYSYLVINRKTHEAAIVDPAWELDTIIESIGYAYTLTDILVTHSHPDHVDQVLSLARAFHARVSISSDGTLDLPEDVNRNLLSDEAPMFAAGLEVQPLLTPGHTSDSICYLIEDNLFSGDTLFAEGCGSCAYETSNPSHLFESLMRLKRKMHDAVRVFPGHSFGCKPGLFFSEVMDRNIYLHLDSEEQFVSFRTRPGQPDEIRFV